MSEQFSQPKPPQGPNPNAETITMHKGDSTLLDIAEQAYPIESLGEPLDPSIDPNRMEVVGLVSSIAPEGYPSEENPVQFALVKDREPSGADNLYIVSNFVDSNGEQKKKWTHLEKGVQLTIGRTTRENVTQHNFIDGRNLTGSEFSKGVSRTHMTVELTDEGVVIGDNSANGTEVQGVLAPGKFTREDLDVDMATLRNELGLSPRLGSGALGVAGVEVAQAGEVSTPSNNNIIDKVPKTPEEVAAINGAREEAELRERNRPVQEELQKVEVEFGEFRSKYNEEQKLSMWKYAAGVMNKEDAQRQGDGQGSIVFGQQAGEGWHELRTPELQSAADKYLYYMRRLNSLRNQLR